jgi:hypothetical protein
MRVRMSTLKPMKPSHRRIARLRRRLPVAAAGVFASCLGIAAGAFALNGVAPVGRHRLTLSSAPNMLFARATAKRLLEVTPLPDGARVVSVDESVRSVLGGPEFVGATTQQVDPHRFWRVPGEPATVIAWIEHHPPNGSRLTVSGSSGVRGVTASWTAGFSFQPEPGLPSVTLEVEIAAAKDGGTATRADAVVVWTLPRPAAEHIPPGIHAVTLRATDGRRHISFKTDITSPSKIHAIIAAIEALERPPAGEICSGADISPGKQLEPIIELAFRKAQSAAAVVNVTINENASCGGSAFFWAGAHKQPELETTGARLALHRIIGRTL